MSRASLVVGTAGLSRLIAFSCGPRLIVGLVSIDLDGLRRGRDVGGELELGVAADLDRRPGGR